MRKARLALVGLAAAVALVIAVSAQDQPEALMEVREMPEQVVVYSLHKGPYEKMGDAIGPMFMAGFQQGLAPQMKVGMAYLNSPDLVEPAHLLTEVRLQVGEAALAKAGTLGDSMDVKKIKAHQVVVLKKPKGVADQEALRTQLLKWAHANGYAVTGGCVEWLKTEAGPVPYDQTESEIIYPVIKVTE